MEVHGDGVGVEVSLDDGLPLLPPGVEHRPPQHLVQHRALAGPEHGVLKIIRASPPVPVRTLPEEGDHEAPPVPQVPLHLLRLQLHRQPELPTLHGGAPSRL